MLCFEGAAHSALCISLSSGLKEIHLAYHAVELVGLFIAISIFYKRVSALYKAAHGAKYVPVKVASKVSKKKKASVMGRRFTASLSSKVLVVTEEVEEKKKENIVFVEVPGVSENASEIQVITEKKQCVLAAVEVEE